MKQVFMRKRPLSKADVVSEEVPAPRCRPGSVVIANGYSLISAGTESASVRRNVKDMVVKAMTDPELRESVQDMLLKDGLRKTADRVHYETTKWTPMGYSGAGVAVEVGRNVDGVQVGQPVAYGGQGHAQFVRAEKNLCVPVPQGVSLREASFVAVGSIALQAVRRAEVQVGDVVAVLGLGLVGQLVQQTLQTAGARVIGSDMLASRIELAQSLGLERGYRASQQLAEEIVRYTEGRGVDRVLICASTSSPQVIEQAVAMCRDRARITVVGMVNLDVPCEDFYRKELDLVISRSYGPGRYDAQYEEHGVDYPIGYVRWTERRNMEEFLRLVQSKKVNVEALISHEFDVEESSRAYETLVSEPEKCLAIVLRYSHKDLEQAPARTVWVRSDESSSKISPNRNGPAAVAVVGCGAFARQFHLPNIRRNRDLELRTVVASSGQSAKETATRYGASHCTTDYQTILDDPTIDAVAIFTRDNSHAPMTVAAIEAGKHVFCEKPLATSYEQCERVADALHNSEQLCMVGFNRRFAPLAMKLKNSLDRCAGPRQVSYRVNAGALPQDHWVYDPQYAAGRVVGEVCHFVDFLHFLLGVEPVAVTATSVGKADSLCQLEDVAAIVDFTDGSVGTVLYTAAGSTRLGKERVEVFADGTTAVLDDFRRLTIRGVGRVDEKNRRGDKGHDAEMAHFASAVKGETPPLLTYRDGLRGTVCCLKLFESVKTKQRVEIDMSEWL